MLIRMEKVPVRLLVTHPTPQEEETLQLSLKPGDRIECVNESLFPQYNPDSSTIKWIYMGRSLSDRLPHYIEPGSAFHVLIRQKVEQESRERTNTTESLEMTQRMDKILLSIIQGVFAIFLSYLWNRYMNYRHEFEMISTFLLFTFSILLMLSIAKAIVGA
jgi:hypothetical protein